MKKFDTVKLVRTARLVTLIALNLIVLAIVIPQTAFSAGGKPKGGVIPVEKKKDKSGNQRQNSVLNRASPEAAQTQKSSGLGVGGNGGKQPTYIKADKLVLRSKDKHFTYTSNVELDQGDMVLTCDLLEGDYDKDNEIKAMTAHTNVVIVKGENIRATGERGDYEQALDTFVLTENPELQQTGSILTGDKVTIFLKENRTLAEGQVRVKLAKDQNGDKNDLNSFIALQKPTPLPGQEQSSSTSSQNLGGSGWKAGSSSSAHKGP